jgi:diguanylate cyclase (GGDEF)-like protein/PAS domain S-box-containing protein
VTVQFALVVALGLIGLSALAVVALIWHRGQLAARRLLALLMVASSLYAFGSALELAGSSVAWTLATYRIQYLGIAFAPTLLVLIAADVTRLPSLRSRPLAIVLIAMSLVTFAIVATNAWHDLYHVAPRMDTSGPFPVMTFDRGPWYLVFQGFTAVALLTVSVALARTWLDRDAPSIDRSRAATLFLASVVPWLGSLVYLSGILPTALDVAPFTLAATSFIVARGILRHALIDVSPIGRDLVFERMEDPAVVIDRAGHIVDHNAAATDLLAMEPSGITGRRLRDVLARAATGAPRERSAGHTIVDAEPVELDGRVFETGVAPIHDRRNRTLGRVVMLRDVTSHVRLTSLLTELATIDELTGLVNRRHFFEVAERVVARAHHGGEAVAVMVIDLDLFKTVNDRYGHLVGDALLRATARAVSATLRPDDVAGRYGGEEFAICLPATGTGGALVVAERLRTAIAGARAEADGAVVQVTASIGVAVSSGASPTSLEALLAQADAAQYASKRQGGNSVVLAEAVT